MTTPSVLSKFKILNFSLGDLDSSKFGKGHLSGTLPLLLNGKYQQPNLTNLETVLNSTTIEIQEKLSLDDEFTDSDHLRIAFLSAAHFNPFNDVSESAMIGTSIFFLSIIEVDDVLDRTGGFGGIGASFGLAKNFLTEISKVFQGQFQDLDKLPKTIPSLDCIIRFGFLSYIKLNEAIPNFEDCSTQLRKALEKDAMAGFLMKETGFGNLYSNETYRILRCRDFGFHSVLELLLLVRGIKLCAEIRQSLIFKVLMKNGAGALSLINDLLGVKKEIKNDEFDNLVLRLVERDGLTLTSAFDKVNQLACLHLGDLILACEKLEEEFEDDETVSLFLETLKTFMDGFIYFAVAGKRYGDIEIETQI